MAKTSLRAEARQRYPQGSRAMRARWVLAKARAATLEQKWGRMIPMSVEQIPPRDQFVPRTLRDAL